MFNVYYDILSRKKNDLKSLAILLDPDKIDFNSIKNLSEKITNSTINYVFVGGSIVANHQTEKLVVELKKHLNLPIILFPGDANQITNNADALLFLSLDSGRNPEYLIEQQIKSVDFINEHELEIIPTSYILIDGENETMVQKVSKTNPLSQNEVGLIVNTAKSAEFSGKKLIYLEAGSGAKKSVSTEIIRKVKEKVNLPIIVGGGIRAKSQLNTIFKNGADLIVIGTAFEENLNLIQEIANDK